MNAHPIYCHGTTSKTNPCTLPGHACRSCSMTDREWEARGFPPCNCSETQEEK